MILVFGTRVRRRLVGTGTFRCPYCATTREFEHLECRTWFHLFWVRLVPVGPTYESVQCRTCQAEWPGGRLRRGQNARPVRSSDPAVSVREMTSGTTTVPSTRPRAAQPARWVAPTRPEPLLRRILGAAFRRRRDAQGRTLADVATAARISIAYLSEIERGRKEPSSEVLVAVCRALGIRLADLLAEAAHELRAAETAQPARVRPARRPDAEDGAARRRPTRPEAVPRALPGAEVVELGSGVGHRAVAEPVDTAVASPEATADARCFLCVA